MSDFVQRVKKSLEQEGKPSAIETYLKLDPTADLAEATDFVDRLAGGAPSGCVRASNSPSVSPIVLFGGLFLGLVIVAALFASMSLKRERSSAPETNISWAELDAIYNIKNKYTDLQKDEYWKKYKGEKVRWSGTVSSLSESFGGLTLQVKMNSTTLTSDLIVRLKDSQKAKALGLKKGDTVSFVGILENWGSILPITLTEGEISN